jgi:hypothetical protein
MNVTCFLTGTQKASERASENSVWDPEAFLADRIEISAQLYCIANEGLMGLLLEAGVIGLTMSPHIRSARNG